MEHPRITALRRQVLDLPLDELYRTALLQSVEYFRDDIVSRRVPVGKKDMDDLEALQQAALAGMMERALQEKYSD